MQTIKPSDYNFSLTKRALDLLVSSTFLLFLSPVFLITAVLIKLTSKGSVLFTQKRIGKDGKIFTIFKFRTMKVSAEQERSRLLSKNQVDGPVFKIYDDPRYTKTGKILAHTGLDELPQLINVLRDEMSLVGPRPLPTYEAELLTKEQKVRELVKPGITSSWVVAGAHNLGLKKWMDLDRKYVINASLEEDLSVLIKTFRSVSGFTVRQIEDLIAK